MGWEPKVPATFTEHVRKKGRIRVEHVATREYGAKHLDVGCSIGYVLGIMALEHPETQFVGLDEDAGRLQTALGLVDEWNLTNVTYEQGSIYDLDARRRFNTISAYEVIEHLQNPLAAFEKLYKVLQKGGTLYVSVPKPGASKSADHVQEFAEGDIADIAATAGFTMVDSYDIADHWHMTVLTR